MVGLTLFATNKAFKSISQQTYFDISHCGKLSFIRNGKPYKIIGSPIFYYYKPNKNIKEWFFKE
jgi:hypothetical protein